MASGLYCPRCGRVLKKTHDIRVACSRGHAWVWSFTRSGGWVLTEPEDVVAAEQANG
jgi:uncharacterized C2H2 Zn-finger protein